MYTEEKLEELIIKELEFAQIQGWDMNKTFEEATSMEEVYALGRYHALTHVSDFDGNPPSEDDLYFVKQYQKYFNGRE